jgi:hypothetical protein
VSDERDWTTACDDDVEDGTADGDEGAMIESGLRLGRRLGLAERALERIAKDWKPGRKVGAESCDPFTVASTALKAIRKDPGTRHPSGRGNQERQP